MYFNQQYRHNNFTNNQKSISLVSTIIALLIGLITRTVRITLAWVREKQQQLNVCICFYTAETSKTHKSTTRHAVNCEGWVYCFDLILQWVESISKVVSICIITRTRPKLVFLFLPKFRSSSNYHIFSLLKTFSKN